MKGVAIILVFACTAVFGYQLQLQDGIVSRKSAPIQLSQDILPQVSWENIKDIVLSKGELKAGFIQADITEYVLKLMTNLPKVIIREGYDPMELSDKTIKLIPTGTVTLTNGRILDASTITVYDAVIAKYTFSTKVLDIILPIGFNSLLITYDYHTKITLLSIRGDVEAKIEHVKLDLEVGFNFSSYHAYVDNANIKDSGSISFKFTGAGLLDWVIDLLSEVFTTLFHEIILTLVNLIIQDPIQDVVKAINNVIDEILQNNVTTLFNYEEIFL